MVEFEESLDQSTDLVFNRKINRYSKERKEEQLYVEIDEYDDNIHSKKWKVPMSFARNRIASSDKNIT
jgi:hypothetical protein